MRIGLLTTSFPRTPHDIAGIFVLGFARALIAEGHEIDVIAPADQAASSFVGEGGALHVTRLRYAPGSLRRTFYGAGVLDNLSDPRAWPGLLTYPPQLFASARSRRHAWDAVVSHWALPCGLVAGAVKGKRRHLAVMHSADVHLLEKLPRALDLPARIAAGADAMLFVSRDLRTRFLDLLDPVARLDASGRAHVCAMGIDAPAPRSEPATSVRKRLGVTGLTLLSLGRLVTIKGIDRAIAAVSELPDVELVVAGDGPARASLERAARESVARVRFVGELHGEDKAAWMAAAHAFVLPSLPLRSGRTEGLPTALLEAMAAGLTPVCSDTGGVRDVVEPEQSGILVPPGDVGALAAALSRLRDERLRARLARNARDVGQRYAWPTLGPHLSALVTGISE